MGVTTYFSNRLSELVKRDNVSIKEISDKLNISEASMKGYMSGDRFPNGSRLVSIANFFDTTTDDLMGTEVVDKGDSYRIIHECLEENLVYVSFDDKKKLLSYILGRL